MRAGAGMAGEEGGCGSKRSNEADPAGGIAEEDTFIVGESINPVGIPLGDLGVGMHNHETRSVRSCVPLAVDRAGLGLVDGSGSTVLGLTRVTFGAQERFYNPTTIVRWPVRPALQKLQGS